MCEDCTIINERITVKCVVAGAPMATLEDGKDIWQEQIGG